MPLVNYFDAVSTEMLERPHSKNIQSKEHLQSSPCLFLLNTSEKENTGRSIITQSVQSFSRYFCGALHAE